MKIKLPLLILGYSPSRVFSTEDGDGRVCFPVFHDPERAETFRRFFAREYHQALDAYVISDAERALPFFQNLITADPALQNVVLDPPIPVDGKNGGRLIRFTKFLERLERLQNPRARRRRRHQHRKVDTHRSIHTKRD